MSCYESPPLDVEESVDYLHCSESILNDLRATGGGPLSAKGEAACEAPLQDCSENDPPKASEQPKKSRAIVGRDRLKWCKEGDHLYLYLRSSRRPLVGVVPDSEYPGLFRVRYPNGALSDFVNLTQAKDAAAVFALRRLNAKAQESAVARPNARQKSIHVSDQAEGHSRVPALPNDFLASSGREPIAPWLSFLCRG